MDKKEETLERLRKFEAYIKENNIGCVKLEKDLYYQNIKLAEKDWYVLEVSPVILYRATLLFDDLVKYCGAEEVNKYFSLINV